MAANVSALLDRAKVIHRLPSDYKLALVLGVDQKSLRNYRDGKTLPDARVIHHLCSLTGDDPALLLVEIEEKRARTEEARALWHSVAVKLQQAAAAGVFSVAALVGLGAGFPSGEAHAQGSAAVFKSYTSWNVAGHLRPRRKHRRCAWALSPVRAALGMLRAFLLRGYRVSCAASIAAA